jgi:hypothetical protein
MYIFGTIIFMKKPFGILQFLRHVIYLKKSIFDIHFLINNFAPGFFLIQLINYLFTTKLTILQT